MEREKELKEKEVDLEVDEEKMKEVNEMFRKIFEEPLEEMKSNLCSCDTRVIFLKEIKALYDYVNRDTYNIQVAIVMLDELKECADALKGMQSGLKALKDCLEKKKNEKK